ncbi:MAG: hypothetical protein ACKPAJ_11920, partial [Actinomycetota bacterium]
MKLEKVGQAADGVVTDYPIRHCCQPDQCDAAANHVQATIRNRLSLSSSNQLETDGSKNDYEKEGVKQSIFRDPVLLDLALAGFEK